jgi:outer membrane protein assembly factor BamA
VLQLRVAVEGVVGPNDDISFVELPRLGGSQRLRGFQEGRFRDKLVVFGTAQYNYPVHQNVSAHLFVDFGKVGRDYEEIFEHRADWKVSVGGGLTIFTKDSVILQLGLGYGFGEGIAFYFSFGPRRALEDRSRQL